MDLILTVWQCLYTCHCPHPDFSPTRAISLFYSSRSENLRSGWEVRTLYYGHNLFNGSIPVFLYAVVDDLNHRIYGFTKIVRGNICGHAYGDSRGSVYQKIGKSCRHNRRLFFRLVKVRNKINGVLIYIRQHFHGNFGKSGLCVTHGCGTVPVHRTEVSVAVHKGISCRPLLGHIYKCAVNGTVAVRVIFTHGIADDTCTFSVRLVRTVVKLDH